MSSLTVEEDLKWEPTHVQVTVLRGRGLRGKGKHGTSDAYTIIQLGKEKYSTCVAEKSTEPEWREECSFELQPGALDRDGRCGHPVGGSNDLVLTVMHRAIIGPDVFLGQAVIPLEKLFSESRCTKNEWYRLNSKTGKKEKERGDIQVTIQFTRDNLTASMFDLVMKDKGASTFTKLKERMRGKKRASDEDSQSAVVPSGYGSLCRMRQRLPSDGGGEEDYEDDEGGEARRSKMRTFFLRGKLRKSSDTRSSTSLGSESSESSSRGGSLSPTAGISVVVSDLSNSPSNSSNLTVDNSPEHTANTSPRSSSLKCEFGDEAGEITIVVPQPTVCVNGSHAYNVQPLDPGSGKPADSLGLGLLQKSLPLSMSLQNLSPRASPDLPRGPVGDGRRWSFDKPGKEEKAAIAAALGNSAPMQGDDEEEEEKKKKGEQRLGLVVLPKAASTAELENHGKKQRRNLFSHGRVSQAKDGSEDAHAATEEKHRGWFGSKDSHSKPSLVVSPKLEPSTDPHPPPPPRPPLPSSHHPPGPPVPPSSLVSPLHHTNPFTPPHISPCNPFFSRIQHNPFYDDVLTAAQPPTQPLLPPLPYLSSSRPPIAQLFPNHDVGDSGAKSEPAVRLEKRPLPPLPTEKPWSKKSANPFSSSGGPQPEPDSEWDDSFEAFAAGRLQSPEDPTTDCKTQQNTPGDHPLENCTDTTTQRLPITDTDNVNEALHHLACRKVTSEAHDVSSQVSNTNMHHLDTFAHFLETIPEHRSFETDATALNTSAETNQTNTNDLTNDFSKMHPAPSHPVPTQPGGSSSSYSPDPGSSGLGSSAEEDFLSCLSSSSDKFSASSSSEEAEAQNFESSVSEPAEDNKSKPSEFEGSNDGSLLDVAEKTVIQQEDGDERLGSDNAEEEASTPSSPAPTDQQLVITTAQTETEGADDQTLHISNGVHPELIPNRSDVSSQPDNESRENGVEFSSCVEELVVLSANDTTDVKVPTTPDEELCSALPSLHIITSSPDVKQQSDVSSGRQEDAATSCSPVPFGAFVDFLSTSSPEPDADGGGALQSSSSFLLQSLYVSTDSQDYQTCCGSLHPSSSISETLHSANSTLCGELSEIRTAADASSGLEDGDTRSEESLCRVDDKASTLQTDFIIGEDFGVQVLAAAPPQDPHRSPTPEPLSAGGVDEFSMRPEAKSATLQRSHSEGALTSAFPELLLLPSFGSDPGAIRDSSSSFFFLAPPGPDLSCLTSFAPPLLPLTPQSSSSPIALCSSSSSSPPPAPPPLANASAGSPPSTPKPEKTQQHQQQQQAANQQAANQKAANQETSPHPVKPLTTAILADEKRTEGRSVLATGLEKLKSTIHPGRSSQLSEQETDRKKCLTEGAGSYYHLNHSELVGLLVQREAELERQRAEFERQRVLLAKREVELRKLKPQVRDLEDYIDTLLVRIMEQKPTLLQVRSKLK